MRDILIKLKTKDFGEFHAILTSIEVKIPEEGFNSEIKVIDEQGIPQLSEIVKTKSDYYISVSDLKAVIDYLNKFILNIQSKSTEYVQNTLNILFKTKKGRDELKEMLIKAALHNKETFKGRRNDELVNILKYEFNDVLSGDLR